LKSILWLAAAGAFLAAVVQLWGAGAFASMTRHLRLDP
jgi:hypothetical protein